MEEFLEDYGSELSNLELMTFLEIVDNINGEKAIGSQEFWQQLGAEFKSRGNGEFTGSEICRIFAAFSKAGAIDKNIQGVSFKSQISKFSFFQFSNLCLVRHEELNGDHKQHRGCKHIRPGLYR